MSDELSTPLREPHWAGERDILRDRLDDEHEAEMQRREDERPDPTYAERGDS